MWTAEHPMWGGIISTLIVALPFIPLMVTVPFIIKNEAVYMIVEVLLMAMYAVSYVLWTKFLNKL